MHFCNRETNKYVSISRCSKDKPIKSSEISDRNAVEMPDITTKYSDSKCHILLKNQSNEEKRLKIRSVSLLPVWEQKQFAMTFMAA